MSTSTLEMPSALSERIMRGFTSSTSPAEWIPQKVDVGVFLQLALADWIKVVTHNEALFKKNVYENTNLLETDIRQHRAWACRMISEGELLAVGFLGYGKETGKEKEFQPSLDLIDQKLKNLFDALIAWHAPLSMQSDIPEDLKQSIQELEEEKVVDLDI